jgi:hypothetical protein
MTFPVGTMVRATRDIIWTPKLGESYLVARPGTEGVVVVSQTDDPPHLQRVMFHKSGHPTVFVSADDVEEIEPTATPWLQNTVHGRHGA